MPLQAIWVEEACLVFSSCLCVNSHTLSPRCWKWVLKSNLALFFFLCCYRYKGFKGNCSISFIEQFRALHQCNKYCEMLGLKSLRSTHQKQRKPTSMKSKTLPSSPTVKKTVCKKAREPRDFTSSEHWVTLSIMWKLLLGICNSGRHQHSYKRITFGDIVMKSS